MKDNKILATMLYMTDCFKLGNTKNQCQRQLSSDVCTYFTNYSIEKDHYSELEVHKDDKYDNNIDIAELDFAQKDSLFLQNFSLTNESIQNKPITKAKTKNKH